MWLDIFNLLSSSNSNLKYTNLSIYDFKLIFDEFVYPTHILINLLVNNMSTLSIWSMRLRNLLTFEKGDQIMNAYSKIGLQ